MIIETSCNRFYRVWETNQDGLEHVWYGTEVKRTKNAGFVTKRVNPGRFELVRKEASQDPCAHPWVFKLIISTC